MTSCNKILFRNIMFTNYIGHIDLLEMTIDLLQFIKNVPNFSRNHHAKFEIDRTIITCLN